MIAEAILALQEDLHEFKRHLEILADGQTSTAHVGKYLAFAPSVYETSEYCEEVLKLYMSGPGTSYEEFIRKIDKIFDLNKTRPQGILTITQDTRDKEQSRRRLIYLFERKFDITTSEPDPAKEQKIAA